MTNSVSSRIDDAITLPDGRRLTYAECGDTDGEPVVILHGSPGTRLGWGLFPGCPFREGVRLIGPDRPGYGGSDRSKADGYSTWPDDVSALADALGLGKFSVIGVSNGGLYALACGWKIPERLIALGIVSSVSPVVKEATGEVSHGVQLLYLMGRRAPWLLRLNLRLSGLKFTGKIGRDGDYQSRNLLRPSGHSQRPYRLVEIMAVRSLGSKDESAPLAGLG